MKLYQKLQRLEQLLLLPSTIYLSGLASLLLLFTCLSGCYVEDTTDDQAAPKTIAEPVDDEVEVVPSPTPEPEFKLWSLEQIRSQNYNCWDDFYVYVKDNYEMFCKCIVEKISNRWEREDYIRHEYSYLKHLSDTESLQRCNELPGFWKSDKEDEEVKQDRQWKPEDEAKDNDAADIGDMLKKKA